MSTTTQNAATKKVLERRVRIDLTLPGDMIAAIDTAVSKSKPPTNRSRWIQAAALAKLGRMAACFLLVWTTQSFHSMQKVINLLQELPPSQAATAKVFSEDVPGTPFSNFWVVYQEEQ